MSDTFSLEKIICPHCDHPHDINYLLDESEIFEMPRGVEVYRLGCEVCKEPFDLELYKGSDGTVSFETYVLDNDL